MIRIDAFVYYNLHMTMTVAPNASQTKINVHHQTIKRNGKK